MATQVWGRIDVGSNIITNCQAVLRADGDDLIALEYRDPDQLLATVELFGSDGGRRARLRRNAWVYRQDKFEITTQPRSLRLTEVATGKTILHAEIVSRDHIRIDEAQLYSRIGTLIEVTPKALLLASGIVASGIHVDGSGGAFVIDRDSFGIGVADPGDGSPA